ncbi:endolytic transglycosylase MltG [Streptomyces sp. NPDC097619]|uniref:endolytic transglycosylase MltG n=1 Tax=Streptomyces sp. NPDC097619 TaxID=3157228 RepID=UPI003329E4E0
MTEYGRGADPYPQHPGDPYGDQGQQPRPGRTPYEYPTDPQYVQQGHPGHPGQPYPQQGHSGHDLYAGHPGVPADVGQYPGPQQPHYEYPQQQYADPHQPQQQYADPHGQRYAHQHAPQYADPHQGVPQYADPQAYYPSQQQPEPGQYHGGSGGGWDSGVPDPYGHQPPTAVPGDGPDLYTTPEAYPPPQPPGRRDRVPEPAAEPADEALTEAEEPEHAFFSGGGDDADGDGPDDGGRGGSGGGRGGRRGGGRPKKKRGRNGVACLFVSLVLVGGVGGIGYYGYSLFQERFGAPEDYAGGGTGSVDVEIPKGASLMQMGSVLKEAGVVKSTEAFTAAAQQHKTKGLGIQPGLYAMKKEMSAAAAVELMVNPANINSLDVNPGERNVNVYRKIDKKLGLQEGTTREIAQKEAKNLGLPAWALNVPEVKDPLEGFLYPARYDLGKDTKPEKLLKQMVARAASKYESMDLAPKAKALGLDSPLDVITVGSLVAAEGKNHSDYRKMSEVIYNRLKITNTVSNRRLEFDSTINYIKNESTVDISAKEARALKDPYNTYHVQGLPPGPIGNPGDDAVDAALNPDGGGWMFFISIDGTTTQYTKTLAEHNKLVAEFNKRRQGGQ